MYYKTQFFHNFAEEIKDIFGQPYDTIEAECFACNYVKKYNANGDCDYCPFIWPSSNCNEFCCLAEIDEYNREVIGLYKIWKAALNNQNKTLYINTARVIANLPIREEVRPSE